MKNKRGFGIIIGGFMKKRVIGLIFLTYIIISLFFLFRYIWIRYETMNIAENIMCNIITGEKRNIKIFSSNRLINVLKKIYNNLPDGIPTANIYDVAIGKTFIVNHNGKMVLRIGRLKKVIIKTNINNFKYLKTSKKFCGYTAGFTNSSGDWDGRTRFVDNRDGTVTDKLTGLMWVKDFDLKGKQTWYDGVRIVKKCRVGGYTNWRLPQVREIETLIDFNKYNPALPDGHPFINVKRGYYWTGTEYSSSEDYAWFIIMVNGSLYSYDKNEKFRLIFCRKK